MLSAPSESPVSTYEIVEAPIDFADLGLNRLTTGSIETPGSADSWQFHLPKAASVRLTVPVLAGDGNLRFSIKDSNGRILGSILESAGPGPRQMHWIDLPEAGDYRLEVEGVGDSTGTYQLALSGPESPYVVKSVLKGNDQSNSSVWIYFGQAMDAGSFQMESDVLRFENSSGPVELISSRWEDATTLVLGMEDQPIDEPIIMTLSASISSQSGGLLDQDRDGIAGEPVDDVYTSTVRRDEIGPRIFLTEPSEIASAPIDRITFHFSEPINASSFTREDITRFDGPTGSLLGQVTGIVVDEAQATVLFASQLQSGQYSITIGPAISDRSGNLLDQNQNGKSGEPEDTFSAAIQVASPDLAVTAVSDPTSAIYGDDISLSWTVTNEGTDPAEGLWWDYVYLSADETWDLGDALVARVPYDANSRGIVDANGGSYMGSITASMPAVLPGNYHVIVRTNLLSTIAESDKTDNQRSSAGTAYFDLPELIDATPATASVNYRDELYYKFEVPESARGGSVLLRFGTDDTTVANELYLRRGSLPTRAEFDERSRQGLSSNQYIILSSLKPGTYYVLGAITPDQQVGPDTVLGTANLQADLLVPGEFSVLDSNFGQGGTAGNRTIEINGINFDRSLSVTLANSAGAPIPAVSYYRVGPEQLYATFDLTGVTPGTYDVVLANSAAQVETISDALEVVDNRTASENFSPSITAPPAFRRPFHSPFVHFPANVTWSNNALNDVLMPVIVFTSTEPFTEDFAASVTGVGWNQAFHGVNSATFIGFESGSGIPGILLPGQQGSRTFEVVPRLAGVANEAAVFAIDVLYDDPDLPHNWDVEGDKLSGSYLSQSEFEDFFARFSEAIGPTQHDYLSMLASTALLFRTLPDNVFDATRLLTQEAFARFVAERTPSITGQIEYNGFDIDFSQLEVVATNTATLETHSAPVRLDGQFAIPNVGAGTFELAVRGGAVAAGVAPVAVTEDGPTDIAVQILVGGTVSGSVLSPSGAPVDGARLILSSDALGVSRLIALGKDGMFEITDLPAGQYLLTATAVGRIPTTTDVTVEFGVQATASLNLAAGTVLSGAVSGPDDLPLSAAQIRLTNPFTGTVVSAVTGDDGRYFFDGVPIGTWDVLVSHPEYQDLTRTISISGLTKSESFALAAGAVVTGRVVSDTGAPVEGAVVGVISNGTLRSVVTGSDGLFTIAGIAPGDATLQIDGVGFARTLQFIGPVTVETQTNLGDVTSATGITLLGRVTDGAGVPIANAVVMLKSNSGLILTTAKTGPDGAVTFTTLASGVYRIRVAADGYASRTRLIEVMPDGQEINLQLAAEATLSGTVAGASDGIVALYLNSQIVRIATVRPDGAYSFEKVLAGDYVAAVLNSSQLYQTLLVTIRTGDDAIVDFVRVTGSLSGVATNGANEPLAGGSLIVSSIDPLTSDRAIRRVNIGGDGTFSINGVHTGQTTVILVADGVARKSVSIETTASVDSVLNIHAGASLIMRGVVRDAAGRPLLNASVYLINKEVAGTAPIVAATDVDGRWEVGHLTEGRYEVVITAPSYVASIASIDVTANLPEQSTILGSSGVTLSGTVKIAGQPIADALVRVLRSGIVVGEAQTDADGRYRIIKLPTGEYELSIAAEGALTESATFELEGSSEQHVSLAPCEECLVVVPNVAGIASAEAAATPGAASRAQSAAADDPNCAAVGLPSDCGDSDLSATIGRLVRDRAEESRVNSIPWDSVPSEFTEPNESDCFCNSAKTKALYDTLSEQHSSLEIKRLVVQLARAEFRLRYGAASAAAKTMEQMAQSSIRLSESYIDEILIGLASLAASSGVGLPVAGVIAAINIAYGYFVSSLGGANRVLASYEGYILVMEREKTEYKALVENFQKEIEDYSKKLRSYEHDRRVESEDCALKDIKAPNGNATVAKGETTSVNLLPETVRAAIAALAKNGTTPRIVIENNPSGSGVTIGANGWARVGDGDCNTFTVIVSLVIECDDSGLFGFGKKNVVFTGEFKLTRTPVKLPVTVNCGDDPPEDTDCFKYDVTYVGDCGAVDPNDITGPRGAGAENWIAAGGPYAYTIGFENDPEKASAPAAVVRVTQTLDADLDFGTFRLGTITFGDVILHDAVGLSSFEKRLDYRDSLGIFLDMRAGINLDTGEAFWELRSIDPVTGEVPFNPLIGFLPPNVDGVEGQGYLSYTVRPKTTVASGTVIDATADIVFDQNEAIETPPIFNSIDAEGPTSSVSSLQPESYPGVLVRWRGDDRSGSGVRFHDVFVSRDSGPFELWLARTSLTEAPFYDAVPGSTYAFYSVATDRVGYRESVPVSPDAVTTILEPARVSKITVANDRKFIEIELSQPLDLDPLTQGGIISSAIGIETINGDAVNLGEAVFGYDATSQSVTIQLASSLAEGVYRLSIDADAFANESGGQLASGIVGSTFSATAFETASNALVSGVPLTFSGSMGPQWIDFNDDGLLDLLVSKETAEDVLSLDLYLNNGSASAPSFASAIAIEGDSGSFSLPSEIASPPYIHDWNGDGELDLLVALNDGRIQLWTNVNTNEQPIFSLPRFLNYQSENGLSEIDLVSNAISMTDVNGDARPDLLVGTSDGEVMFFPDQAQSGKPSLTAPQPLKVQDQDLVVSSIAAIETADLNSDGKPDLLIITVEGRLLFYPNIGSGPMEFLGGWDLSVELVSSLPNQDTTQRFAFGDINGDQVTDMLIAASSGKVYQMHGMTEISRLAPTAMVDADPMLYIEEFTVTAVSSPGWQNPNQPHDVDGQNGVSPRDALIVINYVARIPGGLLPDEQFDPPIFYDVNGDGIASPIDALRVINFIARQSLGEGERVNAAATPETRWLPNTATGPEIHETFELYEPVEIQEIASALPKAGRWSAQIDSMFSSLTHDPPDVFLDFDSMPNDTKDESDKLEAFLPHKPR